MRRVLDVGLVIMVLAFAIGCGDIEKPKSAAELAAYQLDVLFAQADHAELCLVVSGIQFGCREVDSINNRSVAMDDLNNDGVLDAVFGTADSPNTLCLGGQLGGLACNTLNQDTNTTLGVVMADLNGDESLDLVLANEGMNQYCLNNGAADFSCSNLDDGEQISRGVVASDLNGDGNVDFAIANDGQNQLCLNNGAASFSCQGIGDADHNNSSVTLGDLNGDTFLDIIFASITQPNQACLGNGAGSFTCQNLGSAPGKSNAIVLGDFLEEEREEDEPAVLDMIIAATDGFYTCTGDGSGGFASCKEEINNVNTIAMSSGYLNGDDHLDVIFVRETGPSRICTGDGTGKLRCRTHNFQNASGAYGVVMGRFAPYIEPDVE